MRAVLLDISKAFDRVWHRGLIAKSRSIRVEGNLLNGWFISYLSCLGYYKVAGETWLVLCRFALWDCLGAIACFIGYFIRSRAGNWVKVPPPKTIPRCNPPCRPLGETDAISHKSEPGNMANAVFFTRFILYMYVPLTLAISASAT